MNQKAIELYFKDAKNKRTLDIITALLEGKEPLEIAQSLGVSRQAVTNIRAKYLKPASE